MEKKFLGNFTQQEPLPESSIEAAIKVMRHGRLHRYNVKNGEISETALFEKEFAKKLDVRFCLACASGGYAMTTALRALGIKPGDKILTNGFTLAPVPGAIAAAGGEVVFVEITDKLLIDFDDLQQKIISSKSKVLLLSHMRGHICNMDELMAICNKFGVQVIEDCAHTMGAKWREKSSGKFGIIGCYSTQTYKHLNSGEGGILVTNNEEIMARAIMLSGSYMLFERHISRPDIDFFDNIKLETPNCSGRMDNLRAAILRPQLKNLDSNCLAWNKRYAVLESGLKGTKGVKLVHRDAREKFIASSFQFLLPDLSSKDIIKIVSRCAIRGVELKWFGAEEPTGFTSRYTSWQYAPRQTLDKTERILDGLLDLRLPLTFSLDDCAVISEIIKTEIEKVI